MSANSDNRAEDFVPGLYPLKVGAIALINQVCNKRALTPLLDAISLTTAPIVENAGNMASVAQTGVKAPRAKKAAKRAKADAPRKPAARASKAKKGAAA
jgi:hypothetical protein